MRGISWFLIKLGLALAITATLAFGQAAIKARKVIRKGPFAVQTGPLMRPAAVPKPPPPPPVPEKAAPEPPLVTFDGSRLTIISDNSTLADILIAIRDQTGAEIDIPAGAFRERIAARLGPASARAVLTRLLYGTSFDYAIQAAEENLDGIERVLLTPRKRETGSVLANGIPPRQVPRPGMQSPDSALSMSEPEASEEGDQGQNTASSGQNPTPPLSSAGNGDMPTRRPPSSGSGESAPQRSPYVGDDSPANGLQPAIADSSVTSSQSKSEQMMNQLRKMYQQRMQMQEQALTAPPAN